MSSTPLDRDHGPTNPFTTPEVATGAPKRRTRSKRSGKSRRKTNAKPRLNTDPIPMPEPEFPCPDWLDDRAKEKLHELTVQLRELGILERTDVNALVRYADAHVRWLEAALFMRQHGVSYAIKNDAGEIKSFGIFPQATQYSQLATMLLKLEQELGLTPSARTRIRVNHAEGGTQSQDRSRGDSAEARAFRLYFGQQ